MKTLTVFIFALMILNFSMVAAFADDMWNETPGLYDLETPSFVEQGRLVNYSLDNVGMYSETPNLNKEAVEKSNLHSSNDSMIAGQVK